MKAKKGVLDFLNTILTAELTSINQYSIHAAMCHHWGYERLWQKLREWSIEEMRDVEGLIGDILYLEGLPNMQRMGTVQVGENVEEYLHLDLKMEQDSVQTLTKAISHCAQMGDYNTCQILEEMVKHTESQVAWLETQLATIQQVGIQNYLTQQIEKEES